MQEQTEKKLTGYPSIDKPWRKYYDEKYLNVHPPEATLYDYIWEQNKDHLEDIALSYYGREITYGDFFRNIDATSKFLYGLGVRENDRILYLLPNIPETAYFLYGGSRIGAVSDFIDPRPESVDFSVSARKTLSLIRSEKITHIVALDQCYLAMLKPVEQELRDYGIERIIIVSASDSMDKKAQLRYLTESLHYSSVKEIRRKLSRQQQIQKQFSAARKASLIPIVLYSDLLSEYKNIEYDAIPYKKSRLEIIVHTSGTTGSMPKPIPLTNDNLNGYIHQALGVKMPISRGDRVLHILPYFAAFGLVNVVHAYLACGTTLVEVPEFEPKDLGKMLLRNRIQHFVGTPSWFVGISEDPALAKANLSFLKMMTYGGDSMDAKQERTINWFLQQHGSPILTKGHGMSETCGAAAYAIEKYNRLDSFGIPLPGTIYAVVDPETKKMIPFSPDCDYIEGEFIISSPSVTGGVLDGKTIVPRADYDGVNYLLTGDLGRMYRDGSMSFLTRNDRTFTRYDGYKVKPHEIEAVIKRHPDVTDCIISSYTDAERHGKMPIAYIIPNRALKNHQEEIELAKDIVHSCFINNPDVSSRQLPSKIRFLNSFPFSKNSKLDYRALENYPSGGNEVSVSFEETTIALGEISFS